jgi:hypothetical protein
MAGSGFSFFFANLSLMFGACLAFFGDGGFAPFFPDLVGLAAAGFDMSNIGFPDL